jgi:hypothetical protein
MIACLPRALVLCSCLSLCCAQQAKEDATGEGSREQYRLAAEKWCDAELPLHLGSPDLIEVAWAACQVQQRRVVAAVPAIRKALARLASVTSRPSRLARAQMLDALIQLRVLVPAEELLPHAIGSTRIPAWILAAQAPEANAIYFEQRFAAQQHDMEWLASGNLLVGFGGADFVMTCLRNVEFAIEISVHDRQDRGYPPSCGIGPSRRPVPTKMPPMPYYSLLRQHAKVDGAMPVIYSSRELTDNEDRGDSSGSSRMNAQSCYRMWLRSMGGRKTRAACDHDLQLSVGLMSNGSLRTIVRRHQAVIRREFAGMVAELRRRGVIEAGQAALLQPRISVRLVDRRVKRLWALR